MRALRKWIWAALALLVLRYGGMLPFEHVDAGEMCLVETLLVDAGDEDTLLCSIYGQGRGTTVEEALENMEQQAPGRLFLRQVRRVIFCDGTRAEGCAMELPEEIPLGAVIYHRQEEPEELLQRIEYVERNLSSRENRETGGLTLGQIKNQVLKEENYEKE